MRGFLSDLYLRPSCHACPSKSFKSGSDITIADFWGIEKYYPEFDDNKGTSLIFANTISGTNKLKAIDINIIETSYQEAFSSNPSIEKNVLMHKNRNAFFKKLQIGNVHRTIHKYTKPSLKGRIKMFIINKTISILFKK